MRGRHLLTAWAALLLLAQAASAVAQTYPSRPIRQIVPYASGSAADALARVAGDKLAQVLGQPVVIDSRPGANSIVGAEVAARAAADGYTFVQLTDAASALNVALYPKLPYHPRVVGQLRIERDVERRRRVGELDEGIAVGRGAGGHLRPDDAVGAGPAVDDDRLAQDLRKLVARHARERVGGAARGIRHDLADRAARIGLRNRACDLRKQEQRGPGRQQAASLHSDYSQRLLLRSVALTLLFASAGFSW